MGHSKKNRHTQAKQSNEEGWITIIIYSLEVAHKGMDEYDRHVEVLKINFFDCM